MQLTERELAVQFGPRVVLHNPVRPKQKGFVPHIPHLVRN
jgi:hypothetical protein